MRKGMGLVIVGFIVVILGAIFLGVSFIPTAISLPPSGSGYSFQPRIATATAIGLAWSGGPSSTTITIAECKDSSCSAIGSTVATGHGSSGSLQFTAQPGSTYLFAQNGNGAVSISISILGLTYLGIFGLVILIIGLLVAVLGFRRMRRLSSMTPMMPEAEPMRESVSASQPFSLGSSLPPPMEDPMTSESAPPPLATGPADPALGGRAPVTCRNCGTVNEPWLTNCRWCKRPLTSTSSA